MIYYHVLQFFCSITISGITASSNDFTVADDISLTFTPIGPATQFFTFTPNDDFRIEGDEIVLATLSTTNPQVEITRSQIQIIIQDIDSTFILFCFC